MMSVILFGSRASHVTLVRAVERNEACSRKELCMRTFTSHPENGSYRFNENGQSRDVTRNMSFEFGGCACDDERRRADHMYSMFGCVVSTSCECD